MATNYKIINRPIAASSGDYQQVFEILFGVLTKSEAVKCIGTFGNINKPGISDIDILVVFKSGTKCDLNLLPLLPLKLKKFIYTRGNGSQRRPLERK